MELEKFVEQAKKSKFGLFKLNLGLGFVIPFNRPHKIKVVDITDDMVRTIIPFRRKNMNHIRGVHACGMATCAEFASGLLLLTKLGNKKYRLIMESIEMQYHYQAKKDIYAEFHASDIWLKENIFTPLTKVESILVKCEIKLYDTEKNHVATGYTNWQIKEWTKVKTKL